MENSKFLNFICACIPGVGFMYNGLIKRGISVLVLFLMAIEIPTILYMNFLLIIMALPIWFYSFFKTFEIRKRIMSGEVIEDTLIIGDETLKEFTMSDKFKKAAGIFFVIIGILALLSSLADDLNIFRFSDYRIKRYAGPVLFIALGIYILIKGKNKNDYHNLKENTDNQV